MLPLKHSGCRLVYKELHEEMGDVGAEKVYELPSNRFYWVCIYKDVDKFVNNQ